MKAERENRPDAGGGAAALKAFHYARRGWFLAAALVAVAAVRAFSGAPLRPAWLWLWAAGMAWRTWAGFHIDGHSNGTAWHGAAPAYSGPYRLSRHPLYFANLLSSAGLLLYANCLAGWASAALLALIFAHHEVLARSEERHLLAAQGEGYLGYMQVTPRWPWPRTALRSESARARAVALEGASGFPENFAGGAAGSAGTPPAAGWKEAWSRQGGNLARGCAGALIIRLAEAIAR